MSNDTASRDAAQATPANSPSPSPSPDAIAYLCNALQHIAELVGETQAATLSVQGIMADVSDATRATVEAQLTSLHLAVTKSLREMGALLCQEINSIVGIEQSGE